MRFAVCRHLCDLVLSVFTLFQSCPNLILIFCDWVEPCFEPKYHPIQKEVDQFKVSNV